MINKISWDICQEISDEILFAGLDILKSKTKTSFDNLKPIDFDFGNYLISESGRFYYIGESKNINSRLMQHSNKKRSTFYKNYLKKYGELANLQINEFDLQFINTNIGRKEIEEFGIVNLPTILNKFQIGKRKVYNGNPNQKLWENVNNNYNNLLLEGETAFLKQKYIDWYDANPPDNAGIYSVQHIKDGLIYIGESSNVEERYDTHSGTTYFSAFRRHIGTDILNFFLKNKNGQRQKRYFTDSEDCMVDKYLKKCKISYMKINFGRFELEEHMIRKYHPLLNRKENK